MMKRKQRIAKQSGIALLSVMFLIVVTMGLFGAYMVLSRTELGLVKSSRDSASGFNAAEAGLNIRAEEIRNIFMTYGFPDGTSPSSVSDCDSGSPGSGDFECETFTLGNSHSAVTYVEEEAGNPVYTTIPPGEAFAGLSAQEYRYTVTSVGRNTQESNEAILALTFKTRVVPLFQFAIFFDEDLEFFNGAVMTVDGPVHTNGDMYLSPQTGGQTNYTGQVTIVGDLYRGQKSQSSCSGYTGTARALDPVNYVTLPPCSGSRTEVTDVDDWNENLMLDVDAVTVPEPDDFDSFSEGEYWQRADLRLVLRLNAGGTPDTTNSSTGIEVVDVDGNNISTATNALDNAGSCPGTVRTGSSGPWLSVGTQGSGTGGNQLRLYRERQYDAATSDLERTLEVDMQALLNCIHANPVILDYRGLDDDTEQGLVFHMTVQGPLSDSAHNNYSIRLRNGDELQASTGGAASVGGLTVVSDQTLIIWGDYNNTNWIPAAVMADVTYLLSNSWDDTVDTYETNRYYRTGDATSVQVAVVSGIARTGGVNGTGGQDHGADTNGGGAINVFRFNEWFRVGSSIPDFTYIGSIVSLGPPQHSASSWGPFTYYSAPNRVWSFDTRFNDHDNLPPMTPAFVYLRQELFVRDFEL